MKKSNNPVIRWWIQYISWWLGGCPVGAAPSWARLQFQGEHTVKKHFKRQSTTLCKAMLNTMQNTIQNTMQNTLQDNVKYTVKHFFKHNAIHPAIRVKTHNVKYDNDSLQSMIYRRKYTWLYISCSCCHVKTKEGKNRKIKRKQTKNLPHRLFFFFCPPASQSYLSKWRNCNDFAVAAFNLTFWILAFSPPHMSDRPRGVIWFCSLEQKFLPWRIHEFQVD